MKQCSSCGGGAHRTKRCPYGVGVKSAKQLTRELVEACDAFLMLQNSQHGQASRKEAIRNICIELRNNGLFH